MKLVNFQSDTTRRSARRQPSKVACRRNEDIARILRYKLMAGQKYTLQVLSISKEKINIFVFFVYF